MLFMIYYTLCSRLTAEVEVAELSEFSWDVFGLQIQHWQ